MAYQKKDGDIAIFRENSPNPKAPQWKGDALINGVVYQVAFWEKSSTMLAGSIKVKGQGCNKQSVSQTKPTPTTKPIDMDDSDVPW